jgi:ADP-heptose:LPS heptosyltransferase
MAGLIKKNFPNCSIYFLGRSYTQEIIALSEHVDEFINYDEIEKLQKKEKIQAIKKLNLDVFLHVFPKKEIAILAKNSGIPMRVGTTNRIYHWLSCNKLIKLSRKNSNLHEAQLNLKLLQFLNIETDYTIDSIASLYGFTKLPTLKENYKLLIDTTKFNLILHPKSKGSAREWGLENFQNLISSLPAEKYKIFISGTQQDGQAMLDLINNNRQVVNLTGKLSLQQFIAFINACDGLVAASTGPLHIAAALNKKAIGLFAPMRPIHPGRWMPIGKKAAYLVLNKTCSDCRKTADCHCIREIRAAQVVNLLEKNESI